MYVHYVRRGANAENSLVETGWGLRSHRCPTVQLEHESINVDLLDDQRASLTGIRILLMCDAACIRFECHVVDCNSGKLECKMQFRVSKIDIHAHFVKNVTVDLAIQRRQRSGRSVVEKCEGKLEALHQALSRRSELGKGNFDWCCLLVRKDRVRDGFEGVLVSGTTLKLS